MAWLIGAMGLDNDSLPCIDLALISIGCESKQIIKSRLEVEQKITNIVSKAQNATVETKNIQSQVIDVKSCPTLETEDLGIFQKMKGDFKVITKVEQRMYTEITNLAQQIIDEKVEVMRQHRSFLEKATGTTVEEFHKSLKATIRSEDTQRSMAEVGFSSISSQTVYIYLCGKPRKVVISQDMLIELYVENIVQQISTSLIKNSLVQKIDSYIKDQTTSSSALKWLIVVAGLVAFGVLIYYIYVNRKQRAARAIYDQSGYSFRPRRVTARTSTRRRRRV